MSIKKKVLAFILLVSIFIFGGIGVLFYINKDMTLGSVSDLSRKQIQETYGRSICTVDFLQKQTEQKVLEVKNAGELFYKMRNDPKTVDTMSDFLTRSATNFPEAVGNGLWYEKYAFDQNKKFMGPYAMWENPKKVNLTWMYNGDDYNYTEQSWYTASIPANWDRSKKAPKDIVWTEPYLDPATNIIFVTVNGVMYDDNKKIIGVSTVDWSMDKITKLIHSVKVTPNSFAFIVDGASGKFIAHSGDNSLALKNAKDFDFSRDIFTQKLNTGQMMYKAAKFEGKDYQVFYGRTAVTGMLFAMYIPNEELFSEVTRLSNFNMIIMLFAAAVLLMALGASIFGVGKMVTPIQKLAATAKLIESGDLSARSDIVRKDELGALASSFNSMVARLEESMQNLEAKVADRTKELSLANENIMDSIYYAKRIQSSFLPKDEEIKHICKDYFVVANPKDIVGGDFYWMQEYRDGYFIAAIDCTGHGVPGAFMTLIVSSLLEKTLVEYNSESPALVIENANSEELEKEIVDHNSVSPAFILSRLNKEIKVALGQDSNEGESNDGCDGGLIYVDNKKKKIRFAGANTALFMISPQGELDVINSDKHSLGYRHSDINYKYTEHEFDLVENSSFYITTDGITDQIGGDKKISFGKKRLSKILLKYKDLEMDDQKKMILHEFNEYKGSETQRDDNTMIGLRV